MDDDACFSWFSAEEVQKLARSEDVDLSADMADVMLAELNGCAYQFIDIAWPQQQRQSHTAVRKKLASIGSAVSKLQGHLDADLLDLIGTGLQFAMEEAAKTESGRVTARARDEATEAAVDLTHNARRIVTRLAQGIPEAHRINNDRIARTKREKSQHKADEALDELLWNLLGVRQSCLGKPAEVVDNPQADVPAELLQFLRCCLQAIRARVGDSACEREVKDAKRLRALLNVLAPALRERVRRLPERMHARKKKAQERAEKADLFHNPM